MSETEPAYVSAAVSAAPRIAALISTALAEPWSDSFVASMMHMPGTFAIVARAEEALLGVVLARASAGEAEILSLVVAAEARRRGIGRSLLERALVAALAAQARAVHLEVRVDNAAARALYGVAGFIEAGRRRGYYKDGADALVLSRVLGPE